MRTITEHTVYVEAYGVIEDDAEVLAGLLDRATAVDELMGPVVSSNLERRAIGLTATVEASSEDAARATAAAALGRVLVDAGVVDGWTIVSGRQAVIA